MFNGNLLTLLQLTDPTLPIGSYAHSAGLETYVLQGIVHDVQTAGEFITAMLSLNLQYNDAAFVSLAFDAMEKEEWESVLLLDDECTALKLPREIREGSHKLGIRLLKTFQPLCNHALINRYKMAIHAGTAKGHYAIAFGLIASVLHIGKADALTGFYYNASAAMVTNCVKLIPIGQQHGQELLFSLHTAIAQLAASTMHPDLNMLGFCCPALEIRCMQHEQLYSRLYMS